MRAGKRIEIVYLDGRGPACHSRSMHFISEHKCCRSCSATKTAGGPTKQEGRSREIRAPVGARPFFFVAMHDEQATEKPAAALYLDAFCGVPPAS